MVLEIRRTRPTVSGQLALDGAPASGFHGWLELIDELERAAHPPSPDADCCPDPAAPAGSAYAFGDNSLGELGSATNNGTNNPNPTPALVSLPGQSGPVTQIAAGGSHSLAVTPSGQLYAFGDNSNGELGSATNSGTTNSNPTPVLVSLPAGTTIDTVARGPLAAHSLALVSGLSITTGSLADGQVGSRYGSTLSATGGTQPLSWSLSGLPAGLSLDGRRAPCRAARPRPAVLRSPQRSPTAMAARRRAR